MATRNRIAPRAHVRKAYSPSPASLSPDLQALKQRLEDNYAVIAVAIAVLTAQAADSDCDVARCLRCGALDPLREDVERLQRMAKG